MYNYSHFTPAEYDFSTFTGSRAGDQALDFSATTLDKRQVKLSDFFGKWIVLETGSITCPITQSKTGAMDRLAKKFLDVVFLLLYTREAHPGERIGPHASFTDKFQQAKRFCDESNTSRTILVDDLEGSAHKKYGSMPNSVYIINPAGKVVFRGDWNSVGFVGKVLQKRDPGKIYCKQYFTARPYFGDKGKNFLNVLRSAGHQAVWDFIKAFPMMAVKHISKSFARK